MSSGPIRDSDDRRKYNFKGKDCYSTVVVFVLGQEDVAIFFPFSSPTKSQV